MKNIKQEFLNFLMEILPESKTNPLTISKDGINKYFNLLEYTREHNIRNAQDRLINDTFYNTAFKLAHKALKLIDVSTIKMPATTYQTIHETATFGLVTNWKYTPKQYIKYLDLLAPFTVYATQETYSQIFQACYNECEDLIISKQVEFLNSFPDAKLRNNAQRVYVYFIVNPKATINDCAETLGLMPLQVIELKKAILHEVELEETKPYISGTVVR